MNTPELLNILLVDDIPENLELLKEVLTDYGYRVLLADNGHEALQLLQSSTVHLIVADAMMPKMDGFQLCKQVKSIEGFGRIPFVIYTGDYVDQEDAEFARKIGVDRYVMKSSGLDPLVQAVNELSKQVYGFQSDMNATMYERIDDHAFLEQHHAVLAKKLEQKMLELEMYTETLAQKNRALAASEARYRSLFEHASIAIFVLDRATGKINDVNRQGVALLGYTRNELLALPHLPFSEAGGIMEQILKTEEYLVWEAKLKTFQGELLEVEIGAGPIDQPHDDRVMLFVRDVTEQRKMEEQMLQVEKMSLMGRLVSGVAHEIRNPLAATSLHLQYLLDKYKLNFSDYDSLEAAFEGAQRIQQVMEKTLSLARPTAPVLKAEQINDIMERAIWFVKIALQQKNLKLETSFGDNLSCVLVDAKQIQQVVLNLIQNAIDASTPNGIIRVVTSMQTDLPELFDKPGENRNASNVLITIRDHGAGISQEQIKHLFEPFRTSKPAGTGLGLALSKHIMDRHNAEIRIQPAEGGGTIAQLVFPILSYSKGVADVQR